MRRNDLESAPAPCPICGAPIVARADAKGPFLGCLCEVRHLTLERQVRNGVVANGARLETGGRHFAFSLFHELQKGGSS